MSERQKLRDTEEIRNIQLMLRDESQIEKKLRENAGLDKILSVILVITSTAYLVITFAYENLPSYGFAIIVMFLMLWLKITNAERSQLLLMKALQGDHGQEKGEREKLTVEKPCVADSEERVLDGAFEVVIPSFGVDDKRCTLAQWHVADGVRVKKGDTLVTIETDKVTAELEAERDGILRHKVREGEAALVEDVIGWIE